MDEVTVGKFEACCALPAETFMSGTQNFKSRVGCMYAKCGHEASTLLLDAMFS